MGIISITISQKITNNYFYQVILDSRELDISIIAFP